MLFPFLRLHHALCLRLARFGGLQHLLRSRPLLNLRPGLAAFAPLFDDSGYTCLPHRARVSCARPPRQCRPSRAH